MINPLIIKKMIGVLALVFGSFWIYDFFTSDVGFVLTGLPQLIFGIIAVAVGVMLNAY